MLHVQCYILILRTRTDTLAFNAVLRVIALSQAARAAPTPTRATMSIPRRLMSYRDGTQDVGGPDGSRGREQYGV